MRTSLEKGAGVMLFRGEGDLTLQEIVRVLAMASYVETPGFEPFMGHVGEFSFTDGAHSSSGNDRETYWARDASRIRDLSWGLCRDSM